MLGIKGCKRLLVGLFICLGATCIGCNKTKNESDELDRLIQEYNIGAREGIEGILYSDYKSDLKRHITNIYGPRSSDDYKTGLDGLSSKMTEACEISFKKLLGDYDFDSDVNTARREIFINDVQFGPASWQNDKLNLFILEVVNMGEDSDANVTLEFKVNKEGKIIEFDIW